MDKAQKMLSINWPWITYRMPLADAVKYLESHQPSGLIRRVDWGDDMYCGLDDSGFYFSVGMPGNEPCVIIDHSFGPNDFEAKWEIIPLTWKQARKLKENREN